MRWRRPSRLLRDLFPAQLVGREVRGNGGDGRTPAAVPQVVGTVGGQVPQPDPTGVGGHDQARAQGAPRAAGRWSLTFNDEKIIFLIN
jgi:hypothetical protein